MEMWFEELGAFTYAIRSEHNFHGVHKNFE